MITLELTEQQLKALTWKDDVDGLIAVFNPKTGIVTICYKLDPSYFQKEISISEFNNTLVSMECDNDKIVEEIVAYHTSAYGAGITQEKQMNLAWSKVKHLIDFMDFFRLVNQFTGTLI